MGGSRPLADDDVGTIHAAKLQPPQLIAPAVDGGALTFVLVRAPPDLAVGVENSGGPDPPVVAAVAVAVCGSRADDGWTGGDVTSVPSPVRFSADRARCPAVTPVDDPWCPHEPYGDDADQRPRRSLAEAVG